MAGGLKKPKGEFVKTSKIKGKQVAAVKQSLRPQTIYLFDLGDDLGGYPEAHVTTDTIQDFRDGESLGVYDLREVKTFRVTREIV